MEIFLSVWLVPGLILLGKILAFVVPLILSVAYLTYAERRVIAAMQMRRGPNTVGPFGLLQPLCRCLQAAF